MERDWQRRVLMVIPSINGEKLLARMLPTLRFDPANIVVLDQGSADSTDQVCADAGVTLIQLGKPHTYTQACNIGAQLARERGVDYLCVSNNDIVFKTNVLSELFLEMEKDRRLGIVAPSQLIVDEHSDEKTLSYRVFWNLDKVDFYHDTHLPDGSTERQESDYCELTCALIRMSAIDDINFLDDEYGFYYEDADFGYRLRNAGYSCGYLTRSQIDHYSSSTINREKLSLKADYISKNKIYFASKHLGYGVEHEASEPDVSDEWNAVNRNVHPYLSRYGLLKNGAPRFVVAPPGERLGEYAYSTYEVPKFPREWLNYKDNHRALFAASAWMTDLFKQNGFSSSYQIPMGVETDLFHPWGASRRLYDGKTYLALAERRHYRSLDVILQAWHRFRRAARQAKLILLGHGLIDAIGRSPDSVYRLGGFEIARFDEEGIEVFAIIGSLTAQQLVEFYRGVDYSIYASCGEGMISSVLESLACGVPCIHGDYGPTSEISVENALTFASTAKQHDASSSSVQGGQALSWMPSIDELVARLEQSFTMSSRDRGSLSQAGLYKVRSHFTLRHTAVSLRAALSQLQDRDPSQILEALRHRQSTTQSIGVSDATAELAVSSPMHRLGKMTAQRLMTVGRLTLKFGETWQAEGLVAASKKTISELGHFVSHKSRQMSELREHFVGRISTEARKAPVTMSRGPQAGSALLIGYIDAQLGLGESARGLALALASVDATFKIYPFGVGVEGRRGESYMPERYDEATTHDVNIIEVATNELPTVFSHLSDDYFDRSYNILRTYWELGEAPGVWKKNLDRIHEIWAPNAFVAASFEKIFSGTITIVPPCIELPTFDAVGYDHFGLESDRFYFLFSFDYFSFPQRKNPLAVVRAFLRAFPSPSVPVGLVIKSTGAVGHFPAIKEELRSAARYDERIRIIDDSLTRSEMLSLIKCSDCYVSLHRSEGFGLGMAESMMMGKSVIGTDYSGSTDFLRSDTGYPVGFKLKKVAADEYIHTEGQVWADPSEIECAAAMVRVFEHREEAEARRRAGQNFVKERYGPANVGRMALRRLEDIYALRREISAPQARDPRSKKD